MNKKKTKYDLLPYLFPSLLFFFLLINFSFFSCFGNETHLNYKCVIAMNFSFNWFSKDFLVVHIIFLSTHRETRADVLWVTQEFLTRLPDTHRNIQSQFGIGLKIVARPVYQDRLSQRWLADCQVLLSVASIDPECIASNEPFSRAAHVSIQ